MAHDVFLSHSVKDKTVAEAIMGRLESESVTCWMAPRDVVPGADWGESIINAIESSRIMVLIFSQSANASPQIKREVERAVNKGVYIIPFRVEDIPPARALEYFISTSQWMDAFSPPLERHLDTLTKTVKAVLRSPPPPDAFVPAQSERKNPMLIGRTSRPATRKLTLIAASIALAMIVGGAGWYLGQKKHASPSHSSVPAQADSQVAIAPTGDEAASKQPEAKAVQSHGKAVKNSAVLPAEDVANAAQTEQEVSANEGYGDKNSETPGLASKLVTGVTGGGPRPQAIPKIAGKWRDSDSQAFSQITQDGNTFRFARWGTLTNGSRFQSSGRGTISGQRFTSTYYAQYQTGEESSGECSGSISGDGMHIQLECSDSLFGGFAGAANRE
ncbi:MAG TPA: TIR domain-containing protein [Pyrinomonadaceae bacterium]|nr:TIR domain-containing protein [Pyrinomonadaceae bacterium]